MSRPSRRAPAFALGLLLLGACVVPIPLGRTSGPSAAETEWTAAQTQAGTEVLAGRYGVADKVLADFAARFPSTTQGTDAVYWRALYKLDPANGTATAHDAAVLLDGYLAAPLTAEQRAEGTALRRVAGALERASVAAAATTTGASAGATTPAAAAADSKARDEEMQRLRDDLAKANAELERIKRRLAQPKP
jgi:hypothetical protein